ncbi:MAG: DUF2817 domain-containing protein [Gammaproteobacteria bacterium]
MTRPVAMSAESLAVFPPDYRAARAQIQMLAQDCAVLEDKVEYAIDTIAGIEGEQLVTDVLWLGPRSAQNVVVLISATHGVEGFVGAAAQVDLLRRIAQGFQLPAETAVLIIFALNPYGFSWCRRCDEAGIDLNRNFIDFEQALPQNTGYTQLQAAIYNPDAIQRQQLFDDFRAQHGQTAYEVAISGGQYSDPSGPFYGGQAAAHGRRVIEQVIAHYSLAGRRLAVIDIHSGLGPYAHGEVINDHPLDSHGYHVAHRWYGASVTTPESGDSSSVMKLGLLDYCWHELMASAGCYVTLEFGSYPTQVLFDVVLQDHRSWKSGDARAKAASARDMLAHFCPQDVYWRELVLVKARQVFQQALDGLTHG